MSASPNPLGSIASIASTASQSRFWRFYAQRTAGLLLPQERVSTCMKHIIPGKNEVQVVIKHGQSKPSYRNLMTCGSVWTCPVCAAKITEERRRELTEALDKTRLYPLLLTYTFQHNQGNNLSEQLSAMLESFRVFKSGRQFQGIIYNFDWRGSVRALEVTHGANGWHPHMHELVFVGRPLDAISEAQMWQILSERWQRTLQGQGLTATRDIGFDLTRSTKLISGYVTKSSKWGLEHEVTKAAVKKGRQGGRNPFTLLMDAGNNDEAAGRLFIDYANAFKGRNQLVYSKGLRNTLGMGAEKTDAEIIEDKTDILDVILARLSRDEYKALYHSDNRSDLLDIASTGDIDAINKWLVSRGIRSVQL